MAGLFMNQFVFAQTTTITLQPNGTFGKDAFIDSRLSNLNAGDHPDFAAMSWTNGGAHVDVRGLIEFDLSVLPSGSTINSAQLSIYSYESPANGSHSSLSGSNKSLVRRVTSPWNENTVTWNNQPSATTQNQIYLPESNFTIQHYLDIDVTGLVLDMVADPTNSHGFLLKLVTEEHYRRMVFASSDNPDPALHPKLVITFTENEVTPLDTACFVIRPSADRGKDAYIESRLNSSNFGHHPDFPAISWTNGGIHVDARGLIKFHLEELPIGMAIASANLSLYSYNSISNGSHSTISGSNEAIISRIITPWYEETVTWNNQPAITNQNQVYLPASTQSIQDYLDIDVTNLILDMIADPDNSHGFQLKLITEEHYRRMVFASSDNPNPNLHPKLEICFSIPNSVEESDNQKIDFNVYPNPAYDYVIVKFNNLGPGLASIDITDATGKLIAQKSASKSELLIDVSNYSSGIYLITVYSDDFISTKKLIISK